MFFHTQFGQWFDKFLASFIPPNLERHPFDYCLHFGISFAGSLIAWAIFSFLFPKRPARLRKAMVIALFAGIGIAKELLDPVFALDDIASDFLGIAAALYAIQTLEARNAKKV